MAISLDMSGELKVDAVTDVELLVGAIPLPSKKSTWDELDAELSKLFNVSSTIY